MVILVPPQTKARNQGGCLFPRGASTGETCAVWLSMIGTMHLWDV